MDKIRVFIDSNILIDFYSGRMNDGLAEKIMCVGQTPQYELVTSILSAVNTVYVRKYFNESFKPSDIEKVVTILPMTVNEWTQALDVPVNDFEDCLQIVCAKDNGCSLIISRDRDYTDSPIKTLSPEAFLKLVLV